MGFCLFISSDCRTSFYNPPYLKGAGASAFVAILLTPLIYFETSLYDFSLIFAFILSSNYVGCIFGWVLLKYYVKDMDEDMGEAIMFYILLGGVFTLMLIPIFSEFVFSFIFITVSGSVSFYLAQFIKDNLLSWIAILFGLFALIISLSTYLYLSFS